MTDQSLEQLCKDVYSTIFSKKKIKLEARFYPSRSLRHTIYFQHGVIKIKIAESLSKAPERILKTLCTILLLKLFKIKVDRGLYKIYRNYLDGSDMLVHSVRKRPPNPRYSPLGKYFNLRELFDQINQQFFNGQLNPPVLGWSLHKAYRRLGFYNQEKNLLVISQIFDTKHVPQNVVEYLLYHEMLHIAIPTVHNNGRRKIHSTAFRQKERKFPDYDRVQKWLTKNLPKL